MLHKGHRQRVKARILSHGTDSLHYHERLEALLFFAIPYRDTNPTAHLLSDRFGTAKALFSAAEEELLALLGVGTHTAEFLLLLGEIYRYYVNFKLQNKQNSAFSSMEEIAEYGRARIAAADSEATYLLMLNNKMEMLAFERIYDGHPSDAGFSMEAILRPAIAHHAAFAVLFHNHMAPIAIPSGEDIAVSRSLAARLSRLDLPLLEHILIAGERSTPILRTALQKRDPHAGSLHSAPVLPKRMYTEEERRAAEQCFATRLAAYVGGAAVKEELPSLLRRYSLASVIESDRRQNALALGENAAVLLTLLHALFTSAAEDAPTCADARFGVRDAARIVANRTSGLASEVAYVFLLDRRDRLIAYEKCGEGVPGAVPIQPRRLLEIALFHDAAKMILAHTHPAGLAIASAADQKLTREFSLLFRDSGVEFLSHIVVAEDHYTEITGEDPTASTGSRVSEILGKTLDQ